MSTGAAVAGPTGAPVRSRQVTVGELSAVVRGAVDLFAGIADAELLELHHSGLLDCLEIGRDELLVTHNEVAAAGPRIYVVSAGQVAVALFSPDTLDDERAWHATWPDNERAGKIRPQGPLMQLADRNLATFLTGEVFNSRALASDPERMAAFTLTPTRVAVLHPQAVASLSDRHPQFVERLAEAVDAARERMARVAGESEEIHDFFIRNGYSAATTLRVVKVSSCIDCRQCEMACEERFGHKRLSLDGLRLGELAFADACRTCVDRRCVDQCNFGSIRFDSSAGEVVIDEASCTGCASCATSCPYEAIDMVELSNPAEKSFVARLDGQGALAYGKNTPRREQAERIASKCNHCVDYADQACISRCPTGALMEVRPARLFSDPRILTQDREEAEYIRAPRGTGVGDPMRFFAADKVPNKLDRSRGTGRVVSAGFVWTLGLLSLIVPTIEVFLRLVMPHYSLQYVMLRADGMDEKLAEYGVSYLSGSTLSLYLGFAGTGYIIVAVLYSLRRRLPGLKRLTRSRTWFDLHVVGGTIGPLFIVLHSAFHLVNWVAIGLWAFVAVVVSGIIGRLLVTRRRGRFGGLDLEVEDCKRRLWSEASDDLAVLSRVGRETELYRSRSVPAGPVGLVRGLLWLLGDGRRRARVVRTCRAQLRTSELPRRARRRVLALTRELLAHHGREAASVHFDGVFRSWLRIHVMMTLVAALVSVAHIVMAVTFSM